MYEGRTRGKRARYTYSDEEGGGDSDAFSARRSNRQSGISTPTEPSGPTFTASGRQVRSRHGGAYGESMLSGQQDGTEPERSSGMDGADEEDGEPISRVRPPRAAVQGKPRAGRHIDGYNALDEMDDESDATSSGNEWEGGADDEPDDQADDDDDEDEDIEMSDDDGGDVVLEEESEDGGDKRASGLVVSLRYSKIGSSPLSRDVITNGNIAPKQEDSHPALNANQSDRKGVVDGTPKTSSPSTVLSTTILPAMEVPSSTHQAHEATVQSTPNSPNPPPAPIPKAPEQPLPQAPSSQQTALASPVAAPAPQSETLVNPHAYIFDQKPLSPKVEPTPNFQQYQYQPPPPQ